MLKRIIYIVDFAILALWQLPSFLRKPIQIAWINAFTAPIASHYANKQAWRENIRYKLAHNGQVIYLEKMLNEFYNIANYNHQDHENTKQIYIGNGTRLFPEYIYKTIEQQHKPLYTTAENDPLYIYTRNETQAQYADFIIWVPATLTFTESRLRAAVNYYIDTKIYSIKTY